MTLVVKLSLGLNRDAMYSDPDSK